MGNSTRYLMVLGTGFLAACGGGGGGGGGSVTSGPERDTLAPLDPADAGAIVEAVLDVRDPAYELATFSEGYVEAFVAGLASALTAPSGTVQPAVSGSATEPCVFSGSAAFDFNLNEIQLANWQLTVGDTLNVQFNNCSDPGFTASGGLDMRVRAFSGSMLPSRSYAATIDFTFDNFNAEEASEAVFADGQITVNQLPYPWDLVGEYLRLGSQSSPSILDFDLAPGVTNGTDETLSGSLTLSSEYGFGGEVLVAIESQLRQRVSDSYPYAGTIRMSGADGAQFLLEINNETNVMLSIDADGDGAFEQVSPYLWADLLAVSPSML